MLKNINKALAVLALSALSSLAMAMPIEHKLDTDSDKQFDDGSLFNDNGKWSGEIIINFTDPKSFLFGPISDPDPNYLFDVSMNGDLIESLKLGVIDQTTGNFLRVGLGNLSTNEWSASYDSEPQRGFIAFERVDPNPVPLPATPFLLAAGAMALAWARKSA